MSQQANEPQTGQPTSSPSGFDAREGSVQSRGTRRLARMALVVGAATIVLSFLVGFLAYRYSRSALLDVVAEQNLATSQTVVNESIALLDQLPESSEGGNTLRAVEQTWRSTVPQFEGSYLCVIRANGELMMHTQHPELVGKNIRDMLVDQRIGRPERRVIELLQEKASHGGVNKTLHGTWQLAGFAYHEPLNSLVVTHIPADRLDAQIRAVALPWGISLGVLTGCFFPLALALLHTSYRRENHQTNLAFAALAEREQRLQMQFAELEQIYRISPVGLCFMDVEQHFVRINDTLAAIDGLSAEAHIGKRLRDILPDVAEIVEPIYRRVIETGEPALNFEVDKPDANHPDFLRNYLVSYFPAVDSGGTVVGVSTVVRDITERKQAEQALQHSEAIHREAQRIAGVGHWVFHLETNEYEWSEGLFHIFGLDPADGAPTTDHFRTWASEDHHATIQRMVADAVETGRPYDLEATLQPPGGRVFHVKVRGMPKRNAEGRVDRILGTTLDVTEIRKVESELRESEERYRRFIEQSREGIALCEFDSPIPTSLPEDEQICCIHRGYRFVTCNDAFARMYGFSKAQDLIGKRQEDIDGQSRNETPQNFDSLRELVRNKYRASNMITEESDRSGNSIFISNNWTGVVKDGALIQLWVIQQDITDRKLTEAALRESEQNFRTLAETVPVSLNITQGNRRVFCNQQSVELTGYSADELLECEVGALAHPDSREQWLKAQRICLDEGVPSRHEGRIVRKDGQTRWVDCSAAPFYWAGRPAMLAAAIDITDRKQGERQLRQSQHLLRRILDTNPASIFAKDGDSRILFANKAMADFYGMSVDDVVGKLHTELHAQQGADTADLEKWLHDDRRVWETGETLEIAETGTDHSGRLHHYRTFKCPLELDTGQHAVLVITEDISARKHAEAALRESLTRQQLIIKSANIGLWDWNLSTDEMVYSSEWKSQLGYTDDEIPNKFEEWESRLHPDDHKRTLAAMQEFLAGPQQSHYSVEFRLQHHDGSWRWILALADIQRNATGEPTRMMGCHVDITERRQAEEEIRLQVGLLDSVRQAAIATDLEGRVIYWNRFAETLYGWSPDEAVGRNVMDLVVPIDNRADAEEIIQRLKTGQACNREFVVKRRDGSCFPVESTSSPLLDDDNQLVGIIGVSSDISDRKAAQDDLLRMQDETAHLARVNTMAEMAAGLSHELNQPLSAIANLAAVCVARLEATGNLERDKLLHWTRQIGEMAHRSGDIIRGLRNFTQRQRRQPQTTGLGQIIQSALQMLSFELRRSKTTLELDLCEPDVPVTVEVVQIQQVIINLARNAVQAINDDVSSDRRVIVSMRRNVESVEVRVSDTGPGIASDQMERLFEPFVTSKVDGTGIGLALSSRIIQAHKGKLDAWNNDVAGATLRFQLPIQDAAE
ncbi:MAG: PAS domain S-box protein [Planctomycetota bacterium]|nr:PAS domain S-box protein [Planctomycetota bacterium]